jgi:hypothetical protein
MDPQQLMEFLRYLSGGAWTGAVGTEDHAIDAAATNSRMFAHAPYEPGASFNQVAEDIPERLPDYPEADALRGVGYTRANPRSFTGINPLTERLSGEGNLGTLLTGAVLPILAQRGDPMAQYLLYLSKTQGQQV